MTDALLGMRGAKPQAKPRLTIERGLNGRRRPSSTAHGPPTNELHYRYGYARLPPTPAKDPAYTEPEVQGTVLGSDRQSDPLFPVIIHGEP